MKKIPVGISARHVHVSKEHLEILFGKNYELTVFKPLSQPGQYASNEKVKIISPGGKEIEARILGPVRSASQVEISKSDAFTYKFDTKELVVPVRSSGDIIGSGRCTLVGPVGSVELTQGVIIADRHIHMSPDDATYYNVKDGERYALKISGEKPVILGNVLIRVSPKFVLDAHVDTDDGNANLLKTGDQATLIKRKLF
ncbi:MAG: phosphate propanoyltransferase [Acholeplasmatales bacterium]|nr:phosphate propanoyltransferase [Acholeplasmatales bacterium]